VSGSRRRIQDVLAGRVPDRVPYLELTISETVASAMHPGASYFDFCALEDIDVVFTRWYFQNRWIDREKGIYTNEWKLIRRKGNEYTDDYLDGPIHCIEDLRAFTPPDPGAESGFASLRETVGRFSAERMVGFSSKATFNHAWYLMGGMERYLVAMYTEPRLVHALNDMVSEFHLAQVDKAMERGADIVSLQDDYAFRDKAFIPREKFVEFCLPGLRKMVERVHTRGGSVLFHSDGRLDELLDLIVDAGIDFLHPVEPIAMDIREVYPKWRDRVVICGNVDCAQTLSFGTPADARSEVLGLLADVAPGGRYVMTSSNTIHSSVRPDTYRAMLDTLRAWGRYPIDTAAVRAAADKELS
jgi:uroporphyrinogen decarboxylase